MNVAKKIVIGIERMTQCMTSSPPGLPKANKKDSRKGMNVAKNIVIGINRMTQCMK